MPGLAKILAKVLEEPAFRRWFGGSTTDTGTMRADWVVFDPRHAKSVFNRGTWDPADPRMSYAEGGPVGALSQPEGEQHASIAGLLSKLASRPMLQKAIDMLSGGASRDEIWFETGWGQMPNGKWFYEIPDETASLKVPHEAADVSDWAGPAELGTVNLGGRGKDPYRARPAWTAIDHPELFEAYPELRAYRFSPQVAYLRDPEAAAKALDQSVESLQEHAGSYNPFSGNEFAVRALDRSRPEAIEGALSSTLHEMGHAVQQLEGFPGGASDKNVALRFPAAFKEELLKEFQRHGALPGVTELSLQDYRASQSYPWFGNAFAEATYNTYLRVAGEAYARNIQRRHRFNPYFRSHLTPWETLDIPEKDLVY